MARTDIVNRWSGTISFALISTPRRLRLSDIRETDQTGRWLKSWDYIEIDNRGNKAALIYYAFNGVTASSALSTFVYEVSEKTFRLYYDNIDRMFHRATSISAIAVSSTTVYITLGRF